MIWQDGFSGVAGRTDPEEERELRLAAQARAGAEWALGALVARYQPPVTRYLTRLSGNPDFARRAAEQIFVRMEHRIRGPQGGHNLRLWLLRASTEAGLEFLRAPSRPGHAQLADPGPAGLLTGRAGSAAQKLRAGLANLTGSSGRQVRELIFPAAPPAPPSKPRGAGTARAADGPAPAAAAAPEESEDADRYGAVDPVLDTQDPRDALRHRLVRAVLAELPYGDAQCLALHLVAGLNQTQVARALGITASASRRRIVQGLQLFAQRYEAAAASLGLPLEPEAEPELEPEPEREPVATPALAPTAAVATEVADIAAEPTRLLYPTLVGQGTAPTSPTSPTSPTATAATAPTAPPDTIPDAIGAAAGAAGEAAEPATMQGPEVDRESWAPELATVVEPRHEIIVDATPPETAGVLDLAGGAPAPSVLDVEVEPEPYQAPASQATPARRMETRVVEGTVAAVRVVPALTPLPLPEPMLPPEALPASIRWHVARAIPVLTGPLPAIRPGVGPSFAAQPGVARRVPVLTADADDAGDDADRDLEADVESDVSADFSADSDRDRGAEGAGRPDAAAFAQRR